MECSAVAGPILDDDNEPGAGRAVAPGAGGSGQSLGLALLFLVDLDVEHADGGGHGREHLVGVHAAGAQALPAAQVPGDGGLGEGVGLAAPGDAHLVVLQIRQLDFVFVQQLLHGVHEGVETAFEALSNPGSADWAQAFAFLFTHPDTSEMMLETFRETLQDMGAEPTGMDPRTGEAIYTLSDASRALGIAESELGGDVDESQAG